MPQPQSRVRTIQRRRPRVGKEALWLLGKRLTEGQQTGRGPSDSTWQVHREAKMKKVDSLKVARGAGRRVGEAAQSIIYSSCLYAVAINYDEDKWPQNRGEGREQISILTLAGQKMMGLLNIICEGPGVDSYR